MAKTIPGAAGGRRLLRRLFLSLLAFFAAGIILLAFPDYCLAADSQPPTEEQVSDFAYGSTLHDTGWGIVDYIKMHEITKQGGVVEVHYILYVVYTATLPDPEDPETYYAHAAYETGVWRSRAGGPTEYQSGYYGAPYEAADSLGEARAALDAKMQGLWEEAGLEPGWPVVSPEGAIIAPGTGGTTGTGGGSKIPGPGSWGQWAAGTAAAGVIATGLGLIGTAFGGAPATTQATGLPSGTIPWATPEPAVAGGTVDPFDTTRYPHQPANILEDAQGAVPLTLRDTGVALKDGVCGFAKGLFIHLPLTALKGFVEIGRLTYDVYADWADTTRVFGNRPTNALIADAAKRPPSLIGDLTDPSVAWDTLKSTSRSAGKELLPIDEVNSFFDPNASLEEQLWAIPSAVVKVTNLILLSPKLSTAPVPGLPKDLTLIKSSTPAYKAMEAAQKGAAPGVQTEYDAYKAAGDFKAKDITKTVEKGGELTQEQVLDSMSDPATMRVIKKAPEAVQREFNLHQTREVYNPVYDDVTSFMKNKQPGGTFRMGSVRTPGQKSLTNTDNDAILQELVKTKDGMPYWKEVPAKEWESAYYESFSKRTGFDLDKAQVRFPEKNWKGMSLEEQQKTWTEAHGQECMDVKNPEAAQAFSDQPTVMDPKWQPGGKSPVADGRMVDAQGLGMMEEYKVLKGWKEGTLKAQTEAMEQGGKLCTLSKKLTNQYMQRTGKNVRIPEEFKAGEQILNMRNVSPKIRDAALKELGFKGGYEDFMKKLSSWTGGLQ